jgi:hypothetical protein
MDHAEARELLEIAAIEPGGFARLVAGDTPEAAALAGHLAGCPDCAAELERLRLSASVIRDAVRLVPPPELRERTLAFVAAVGRPRGAMAGASASAGAPPFEAARIASPEFERPSAAARAPLRLPAGRPALWLASLAAAIVIAVAGTAYLVGPSRDGPIAALAEEVDSLRDVSVWTIRVDRQADARHVALSPAVGGVGTGDLIYSPSSTDVVVVATGLTPPADGTEYRCWVETGGTRQRVGKMFMGAGIAYWVGSAPSLSGLGPGSTFGVSLVPVAGDPVSGEPVLAGRS